jgi:hypothetical protein
MKRSAFFLNLLNKNHVFKIRSFCILLLNKHSLQSTIKFMLSIGSQDVSNPTSNYSELLNLKRLFAERMRGGVSLKGALLLILSIFMNK